MSVVTYVFGIVVAALALVGIVELMRRSHMRERHALLWLIGGVLALVIAIFPQVLAESARILGITAPTNLAFFVAIILLFLVSLQYAGELTKAEAKVRTLAEQVAFLDERIRRLEQSRPIAATDKELE